MTPERLKALRELCDRATPGPWRIGAMESFQAAVDGADDEEVTGFIEPSDAGFIATARTAIPELLDYVARLEQARALLRQLWDESILAFKPVTHEQLAKHIRIEDLLGGK